LEEGACAAYAGVEVLEEGVVDYAEDGDTLV
jgi:hypothetical protein